MANYSKFLSLISGADRTVDLSLASSVLELGGAGLQMDGSTSGHVVISASATTTTYSLIWPPAQSSGPGMVLSNDGTGVLSWVPAASGSVTAISVNSSNGFAGTSSGGATPALTLSTTLTTPVIAGNGTALIAATTTGTGSTVVLATSPTLVTPALGTPSAVVLTNGTGLPLTTGVTGILPIANGGTNAATAATAFANLSPLTTAGDIIYENATPAPARLAIGTTGQVLTVAGGLPIWATPATSGTVTSVAFSDASTTPIYTISGSPVTTSGTLTQTLATQTANTIFAGPASGSAAQPTFRAAVIADLSFAGSANGVATLDGSGKIPVSQLPSVTMEYQQAWTPSTNTPALSDGTGTNGYVYRVNTASSTTSGTFADPSMTNFQVGDLIIYSGALGEWQKCPAVDGVSSVNSAVGAVTLTMATANGLAGTYSGTALTVSTTLTTPVVAANGTALIAGTTTGTGSTVVLATSPTLVTPALGTPSAVVLTNGTGLPLTTGVTGILPIANGGTNAATAASAFNNLAPTTATGGLIVGTGASTYGNLAIGTTGQVLTVAGGTATWAAPATGGTVTSVSVVSTNGFAGTVATATTTPAITLSTTLTTPVIAGNGTALIAATTTGTGSTVVLNASPTLTGTITAGAANFSGAITASNFSGSSSGTNTGDQTITLTGPVTGSGTGSFATTITAGAVGTTQLASAAVTAPKLGTVTDGITTDQNGAGSTIEVLSSPSLKRTLIAGQTFTANTSYAVRWGITANGETSTRIYQADITTSSFDLFYVIGMTSSATTVTAGNPITVTTLGSFVLSSSDTAFAATTDGLAVFLTANGTFSVTAPSSSGQAVTRIGIVQTRSATVTANVIDINCQVVGVN